VAKCWARSHSQCGGKISREHLVSGGVFEQQNIYVQGFQWCQDEEAKISLASITSKILCRKHNSELSPIDKEGINAVRIFESLLPENLRSNTILPENGKVNGYQFERWLLKTAINVSYKSNLHIGLGMSESQLGLPSPYLLAVVFGGLNFTHNMGVYMLTNRKPTKFRVGEIAMFPVYKDGAIGGFFFHIRGLKFFLSLLPGSSLPKLRKLGLTEGGYIDSDLLDSKPHYRLSEMIINNHNSPPQNIEFCW
jgi:hypothetical protein